MTKAKFVYVTYIAAPPEAVWDALTDGETTKRYWGHSNVSDWKVGSAWEHQRIDDPAKADVVGKVIETARPHRLVISWASPADRDNPERTSRVTFELQARKDQSTRLTVVHDELEPDSKMLRAISGGWPVVLSSLKSFLETGNGLSLDH